MSTVKNKSAIYTMQPKELLDQVAGDAKDFSLTKDGVVQAALTNHFLFKKEERRRLYSRIPKKIFGRPLAAVLIACACFSSQAYTADQLADSIRIEEGNNPHWLYGIHHQGKNPLSEVEARRRCLETIRHYRTLEELSAHYCPANRVSWLRNVRSILKHHAH